MSAELYDAEMAGALARPAIDVLPTQNTRKGRAEEHVPEPQSAVEAPVEAPFGTPTEASAAPEPAAPDAFLALVDLPAPVAPATEIVPEAAAETPAPRKVFGMSLTRGRKPKNEDAPELEAAPETELLTEPVAAEDVEVPASEIEVAPDVAIEPSAEASPDSPAAARSEIVALEPSVTDHTDEVRAMRALLEASEQVRQAAEARTAAAESQLRTVTNSVQEWQIRHREAEATITELAGSLAGAEGRMAELHQQVNALQTERDELVSQLDTATSPATS
jgi:hypothetical protein